MVNFVEASPAPAYQRISERAKALRRLGLSYTAIARALGVTDKTAVRAVRWLTDNA